MSKKKLGGTLFCYNAVNQDYCISEAINSLKALCDEVVLLDAGSSDGSDDVLKSFEDDKTKVICCGKEEWKEQEGRQKLSYFTNLAINELTAEWNFNLQADEVIHENSFEPIKHAINNNHTQSYWVRRINLWGNSSHYLDVPDGRKPVGDVIIRLAKSKYLSIDDAQSLDCQPANPNYVDQIRIYHMGFVRNKFVHTEKIRHMLEEVFQIGNDERVKKMNGVFDPFVMFSKEDLKPIQEPLPIFVQGWASIRDAINDFNI